MINGEFRKTIKQLQKYEVLRGLNLIEKKKRIEMCGIACIRKLKQTDYSISRSKKKDTGKKEFNDDTLYWG